MAQLFRIRVLTFLILLYGAIVLNVGLSKGDGFFRNYVELKESKERLASVVSGLDAETRTLEEEVTRLHESPSYAEKVLRDKYHIREENEEIIFFDD